MRTQQPHHHAASRRDVVVVPGDGTAGAFFPGPGLCCPDDPLDLVLQLFPSASTDRAAASLAALGIGGGGGAGGGEPAALRVVKQEPESPPPPLAVAESANACGGGGGGGGGVGGVQESWDLLSSFLPEGLWSGFDDVDMFFADDDDALALDAGDGNGGGGGGEAVTQGNNSLLCCDPVMMEVKPEPQPPAHVTAGAGAVPNDASAPLPAPMPAGAFHLQQAYNACRAFGGDVFNNASPPPPAAAMPAGGAPTVFVTSNSTPPLPALMAPAVPAPMPPLPAAGLHACGAVRGIFSNGPPVPPPLSPCGAWPGIVSNIAPALPPTPLMPARALHPNAAAWAGVYSITKAPVHAPLSATPSSSSPPSLASSGSGHWQSSSPTSKPEFLPTHHVWVLPRKQRSAPPVSRRRRPWVLDFPLHALPPVVVALPPPANPGGDDVDDAKNRYALVLFAPPPPGNTGGDNDSAAGGVGGGGIRRRRPAPRQRNRQAQRVCSHCHSPETPQWRAGPDGPGTLCNACGIRYAANKLLPEYRPSTAPSFRSGQHSNRHRKVMKLREQQMKAATEEDKPSPAEQQPPVKLEHGAAEQQPVKLEHDDGFMGVCEYISAAGL